MDYFTNISYLISHIFLMLFLYLFVSHRYAKWKTAGICFCAFLLLTFLDLFKLNLFPHSDFCYVVVTILQIVITQFTGVFISRARDGRVLFITLSASNYVITGSIAASVLYIYTGSVVISLVESVLIHSVILLVLYFRIRTFCLRVYEKEFSKNWWELCLIPVFFYCGFSFLSFFPHTLYENPDNIPGTTFFIITMFVSYVVVLRYLESVTKNADIYLKNMLFESYIRGLENQYQLVAKSERNLSILRHDMRHYINMLGTLLAQGEYSEAQEILDHITDVVDDNKIIRYCNNVIINSILSAMMEKARSLAVKVHLNINMPQQLPVNDYEFASVIANLLDNALMCAKDLDASKKYVDVKIHCSADHILLQTKNEYVQEMIFDATTGLPKSSKGAGHGLGMKSVSAFSDKIGGSINCFCDSGIFHIMLLAKF